MKKEDMLAPFDTLAAYDKLKEVFTEEQARVIVEVMRNAFNYAFILYLNAFDDKQEGSELKGSSSKNLNFY